MLKKYRLFNDSIYNLSDDKSLITTLNAHSYNVACKDKYFQEALYNSDVLIPDGISVVRAIKLLTGQKLKKIAGADLFFYEMEKLQKSSGKCFFLGSSDTTLVKIKERAKNEYPNVIIETYSSPYKPEFSEGDNQNMIDAVNLFKPDVLFIGMTAPKQEKWAYQHYNQLNTGHICCIGAVFDFYAGTIKRAPNWMISLGLEWLYRLLKEPKRMWRRYLIGNLKFVISIVREKYNI